MTTLIVFSDATDGTCTTTDSTYSSSRAGTGGVSPDTTALSSFVGQRFATPSYNCHEVFYGFDTSTVGLDSTVSAALLGFTAQTDQTDTDFTLEARSDDWGATLTSADYVPGASLSGKTLVATFDTTGLNVDGVTYNTFTDVALPANVNHTGFTRLVLVSSRLTNGDVPVANERFSIRMGDSSGTVQDPKLTVTYSVNRMAFISGDRAQETTTTTGTGDVTLAGAASGKIAFSAVPGILSGDVVAYTIQGTTEWEVGIGSWHTGSLLYRDKVLASSNSGALVSFSAGSKDVFNQIPAAHGLARVVSRIQAADLLVLAKGRMYAADDYEIVSGKELELGVGATLEVG